jgi:regulatory protein
VGPKPQPRKPDIRKDRREVDPLDSRAARGKALDALARRDYASVQLRSKLVEDGFDAAVVDALIERLQTEKLLDDRRYLENFVTYHAGRGQGPNRVRADLVRLGVAKEEAEAALGAYPDWPAQLNRARQKKFGSSRPTNYADRQRQARFLAYRGYTGALIRTALGVDTDLDVDTTDES